MVYLLGQTDVLRHGPLRIWAERGMIRIEDSRDNSYSTVTIKDFALRVAALNDMIKNSMSTDPYYGYNEIVELQRLIDGYVSIMRKAQEQGAPDNPDAIADRKRRKPLSKQVVLPVSMD
jgi:hypothetical protein